MTQSEDERKVTKLFKGPQAHLFEKSMEEATAEPVDCLGQTFESDEARRAHYLELLNQALQDPEFRKTPGFPNAADKDILRLSDPPYYTACPNPFMLGAAKECIRVRADEGVEGQVVPFASDVTEGKGEHFYNVHTYHTKVPYRAIARFLLHYTRPGDLVLDAFCGTGMVGLAAQACEDEAFVRTLSGEASSGSAGPRNAFLIDLSPAAAHIAANYNSHMDVDAFQVEAQRILRDFEDELGWMFTTLDDDAGCECPVDYYVWSDIFGCPECGQEVVFWEAGVDQDTGYKKSSKSMTCGGCGATTDRNKYERVTETYYDEFLKESAKRQKEKLVLVAYRLSGQKKQRVPGEFDREVLKRVESEGIEGSVPVRLMMDREGPWGDMYRAGYHVGISHFHHFYYRRTLRAVAWLWNRIESAPRALQMRLRWWLQSVGVGHTRLNRYFTSSYSQVNRYLKGFLYIAQVRSEVAPWYSLTGKIRRMGVCPPGRSQVFVSTSSATSLALPDKGIDYIFTDPPFGGNIIYSELNFMWEAWLRVTTQTAQEAIVSGHQDKSLADYESLMEAAFREYFRVLRPGRWITIVFHNSHNAVWTAIQSAMQRAGFVVADVRVFDKKQLTMKQQTAAGTVQKDLLITAYRPGEEMAQSILAAAGSDDGVWEFVSGHLAQLPVVVRHGTQVEQLSERMRYMLFDRTVAFYVERGMFVPLSAAEFYVGIAEKYPVRDDMYFLPEQVVEYDRERAKADSIAQLTMFVSDEASAIQWVRQQLLAKPQTFRELQPEFMRELKGWAKHEAAIELEEVLSQNFLLYNGEGAVPSQLHSYLSTNYKDCRNLQKTDRHLRSRAEGRWYVPDPNKEADLEGVRARALLREFEQYKSSTKKKIKQFRTEAVRAGFKRCYDDREYQAIVDVAAKLPEQVIQADDKLLMYYDVATMRLGD